MERYNGELLFEGKNEYGIVEVVRGSELMTLHFGTPVMQSSMYLHDPIALEMEYNRLMMISLVFNPHPDAVLFLGLGGGSKQKFLWKHIPQCRVETAEINSLVIDAYHRYFSVPHDGRFIIHHEEAMNTLKKSEDQAFDFIFTDLFMSSGMSETVGDENFFSLCQKKLKQKGLLIWNFWSTTSKELLDKAKIHLYTAFGFNSFILLPEESANILFFIFNSSVPSMTLEDLMANAAMLTEKTGMDFKTTLPTLKFFKGADFLHGKWTI
jgi:spermidine synthase